jgi:hypothetical protein
MKPLKAIRTDNTPEVVFLPAAGSLSIEGECYPENQNVFFAPIVAVIKTYLETSKPAHFDVSVRLIYVNSASTKSFRQLFGVLNAAAVAGCSVDIEWAFDPEDDAMQDLGQDLMYCLGATPIVFREIPLVACNAA